MRWSVVGNALTLNVGTSTDDEITVVATQRTLPLTLDDNAAAADFSTIDDEVFGTDDGFNLQRESLLKLRVANQCMMTLPGRDNMYRANKLEAKAELVEHEMHAVYEDLRTTETPIINETRVVDVDS